MACLPGERRYLPLILVLLLIVTTVPRGSAQTTRSAGRQRDTQQNPATALPALKQMTLEQLSQVQVTTVTRTEQSVIGVPAAISVITDEDVKRTGARTLPDLLRMATGLEVAEYNNSSWPISARGFNTTSANKLQVFLDGRSLYTPLFGGIFSDTLDTFIPDIERIEVIRGPGATLWGGNAVNGVINIVTKNSRETQGSRLILGGGSRNHGFGGYRYGGTLGSRLSYRVWGKFMDRAALSRPTGNADDEFRFGDGGFRADAILGGNDALTIEGRLYEGQMGTTTEENIGMHAGDVRARWTRRFSDGSDIQLQTYWDRSSRSVPELFDEIRNTYDLDFQHHLPLERHDVVWGAGYRLSNNSTRTMPIFFFDPTGRHLAISNIFAEDEISLAQNRLTLTLGSKFEHNTYSGWEVYPSARLAWTPAPTQTLWGAISRSVRIPTEFDRDLRIAQGGLLVLRGDRAFKSEKLIAYEVGFRKLFTPSFALGIAGYFHSYDDLRSQEFSPTGLPIVLQNKMQGHTYGVEMNATFQIQPWWRIHSSYSNLQKHLEFERDSTDPTGGRAEGIDPRNQGSIRSYMDLPFRTQLDVWARHVSALSLNQQPSVPSYTVFDVRLGWQASPALTISLLGRNLPDRRHQEFGPNGDYIPREVFVELDWSF